MTPHRSFAAFALLVASTARAQTSQPPGDPSANDEASAGPGSSQVAHAREEFRLGSALAKQGRWSDALAAFERSMRLKEHPVTTYNHAYCARALGQFVRAYREFQAALAPTSAAGGAVLPDEYQVEARAYVVELKQRIAHATVTLGAADMTIRVDGMSVAPLGDASDPAAYFASPDDGGAAVLRRRFDLWLDPGNHVFIASRPGTADVTKVQSFAPGASEALVFADLKPPAALEPPVDAAPAVGKPDRTWAIVSLGVGAAGFVASGVFAILSLNLKSDLQPHCTSTGACPSANAQDVDRMQRFADYATAGLVIGGVGAAVGATLWLTAKPSTDRAGISPWVGIGSAGATARF